MRWVGLRLHHLRRLQPVVRLDFAFLARLEVEQELSIPCRCAYFEIEHAHVDFVQLTAQCLDTFFDLFRLEAQHLIQRFCIQLLVFGDMREDD